MSIHTLSGVRNYPTATAIGFNGDGATSYVEAVQFLDDIFVAGLIESLPRHNSIGVVNWCALLSWPQEAQTILVGILSSLNYPIGIFDSVSATLWWTPNVGQF